MQEHFYKLADALTSHLKGDEVLLCNLSGESSDFVRFNHAQVRQATTVHQAMLSLELIVGDRRAAIWTTIAGRGDEDARKALATLEQLRAIVPQVPPDPYLLYNRQVTSGEQHGKNLLPSAEDMVGAILREAGGTDMVGILAGGGIYNGFANSLGQRNWFDTHSFNLDWSLYHHADKAVKTQYAGFEWSDQALAARMRSAREQIEVLSRPAKTISRGRYRVFLSPAAMDLIMGMVAYDGFGIKAHRTKTTPLLKMLEAGATLDAAVNIGENSAEGIAPTFQSQGFVKPAQVKLIDGGRPAQALVSPRSAREYGLEPNGANSSEAPESLDMAGGKLDEADVLSQLDTGVLVNHLWYLNFSDRPACRITGLTRFATFWVEGGKIIAPINTMRFDETIYRMLGENLLGLTRQREFIPSAGTYGGRSTRSSRLPGALVRDFAMTL